MISRRALLHCGLPLGAARSYLGNTFHWHPSNLVGLRPARGSLGSDAGSPRQSLAVLGSPWLVAGTECFCSLAVLAPQLEDLKYKEQGGDPRLHLTLQEAKSLLLIHVTAQAGTCRVHGQAGVSWHLPEESWCQLPLFRPSVSRGLAYRLRQRCLILFMVCAWATPCCHQWQLSLQFCLARAPSAVFAQV